MESLVTSWSWEHLGKLSDMMKLSDNPIRPDAWFTTYPVVRYWKCLSVVVLVQERMNQWWETCSQEGGVGNTIHCETDNSTEQSIQYSNLIKTMQWRTRPLYSDFYFLSSALRVACLQQILILGSVEAPQVRGASDQIFDKQRMRYRETSISLSLSHRYANNQCLASLSFSRISDLYLTVRVLT